MEVLCLNLGMAAQCLDLTLVVVLAGLLSNTIHFLPCCQLYALFEIEIGFACWSPEPSGNGTAQYTLLSGSCMEADSQHWL